MKTSISETVCHDKSVRTQFQVMSMLINGQAIILIGVRES